MQKEMKENIKNILKSYESKGNRVIASAWIEITTQFQSDDIDK